MLTNQLVNDNQLNEIDDQLNIDSASDQKLTQSKIIAIVLSLVAFIILFIYIITKSKESTVSKEVIDRPDASCTVITKDDHDKTPHEQSTDINSYKEDVKKEETAIDLNNTPVEVSSPVNTDDEHEDSKREKTSQKKGTENDMQEDITETPQEDTKNNTQEGEETQKTPSKGTENDMQEAPIDQINTPVEVSSPVNTGNEHEDSKSDNEDVENNASEDEEIEKTPQKPEMTSQKREGIENTSQKREGTQNTPQKGRSKGSISTTKMLNIMWTHPDKFNISPVKKADN